MGGCGCACACAFVYVCACARARRVCMYMYIIISGRSASEKWGRVGETCNVQLFYAHSTAYEYVYM